MRITKIESQQKNPTRKNLYADGEFIVGVSAETLIKFAIRTGDEIGEEKLKALQATEELQGAKTVALRFLSRRQRTEKEIRDKLRSKEFADEEIIKTIENLRELGFLNDEAFARSYIRHQLTLRPKGKLVLKQKLLLLGINKETVDAALTEAFQETSQEDAALEAAEKFIKKSSKSRDDPHKTKQKLAAFLTRRGFPWDVVSPVLKNILGEKVLEEE
jgi:regulatory protein